jgi:hypothetical protein
MSSVCSARCPLRAPLSTLSSTRFVLPLTSSLNHAFPVAASRRSSPCQRHVRRHRWSSFFATLRAPLVFLRGTSRARRPSPFSCARPARGGRSAERRTHCRSRVRGATTVSARHGPPRATGRRLSALHRGGLRTARPRDTYPVVPRTMARLPAAGCNASRSGPAASRPQLHRGVGTPHPAPPQNVSGDAPHELGYAECTTGAHGSQQRILM